MPLLGGRPCTFRPEGLPMPFFPPHVARRLLQHDTARGHTREPSGPPPRITAEQHEPCDPHQPSAPRSRVRFAACPDPNHPSTFVASSCPRRLEIGVASRLPRPHVRHRPAKVDTARLKPVLSIAGSPMRGRHASGGLASDGHSCRGSNDDSTRVTCAFVNRQTSSPP